jgi:hypothetical protein
VLNTKSFKSREIGSADSALVVDDLCACIEDIALSASVESSSPKIESSRRPPVLTRSEEEAVGKQRREDELPKIMREHTILSFDYP